MKAKHVFMSLVLPSVLAACTADDFVTEQGDLNLSNRPVVGNVEFVLPGAETRVDVENGKYKWTENDKLGAALMDTWDKATGYTISNNLFTNYRYDYVNGSFTNSNAVFVEGNYFIYAPFNANQKREGLAYSINNVQEAGEDGTQALTDNQFFLDHIFVAQGNASVEVNPIAVFPRVILNAQYEGSEDVQINKIVITDLTGKFGVNGKVEPASTSISTSYNVLANVSATAINGAGYNVNDYIITGRGDLAQAYTKYKLAINDLNVKYTLAEGQSEKDFVNPNIAAFYAADTETKAETMTLKYTVPSDDVKGIMVAPIAETHSESNVTIELYTNRGLVTIAGNTSIMSNNFDLSSEVATYPTELGDELLDKAQMAVAFTGVKDYIKGVEAGKSQNVTIKFKDDAILVPPTLTVTSTEELKYYLNNWYAGKKNLIAPSAGNEVVVTAAPAEGEAIELDGEVLSFIKNTAANPTIKFVGNIVIPADADPTTINYIKKGDANLNVTNYATQDWTATGVFTTLTNEGTLTIGTGAADETATYEVTAINNNNSLTVNKAIGAGLTDYVNNLGTLVANANIDANVINGTVGVDGNHTAKMTLTTGSVTLLKNHAEVEVPAGKNVTVQKIENYYNVVVSGTLKTATVTKSSNAAGATITLNEGAKWNVADPDFENNGTVTNKGTITVAGKFTNKGTVNNYKQIACSDGASFNNEKLMNVYANSITLISKNSDAGAEIIVEQGVTTINVAGEDKGKITFVVSTKEGLKSIPTIANSLRITAAEIDLSELNNKKITFVEFKPAGNMSITCKSDDEVNSFEVVTFTADSAEKQFNLNGNLTANENLTIGTNATVVINDKLTFGNATGAYFVNNGSMLIIGTLNFSAIAVADKGTVELGNYLFAGGSASTNITWKPAAGDGAGTIG